MLPIAFDELVLDIKIYVACECRCTSSHRVLSNPARNNKRGCRSPLPAQIGLGSHSCTSPSWSSTKSILPEEILTPGVKVSTSLLMKPISSMRMDLQLLATLIIIGFVISLVIEFSHLENQKYSTRTRTRTRIYTSSDMRYPTPNVEQVSYTSCTRNEGCRSGGPYVFLYSPNLGFTTENPDRICFFSSLLQGIWTRSN